MSRALSCLKFIWKHVRLGQGRDLGSWCAARGGFVIGFLEVHVAQGFVSKE